MQVTADQTNPCTMVLDITVDEPRVSRAFDVSFREFSRYVSVPGFRPGKAPRVLVEKYVDMGRVRQHTLERIIRETYPTAVKEQDIKPYRDPDIEPTDLEDKKPYTYRAVVPLEPQVELGPYTGLSVDKPIFKITDVEVDASITRMREEKAKLERVADREIEDGDVVIAEHEISVDGAEDPEPARRQLVYIGNNIPGYDESVMGMMPGDERTFDLTYPDDFDEEARRGKRATYTVKVISISARRLPELDDAFAKEVANVDTVEDLRDRVRERLEADSQRASNEIAEQRIIEKILASSTVHFPDVLVREELDDKLRNLGEELQRNNVTYEQYLHRANQTAEQHQSQLMAQSSQQIRALLMLRQIAIKEGLQADNESIDAEFDRIAVQGAVPDETVEQYRGDQRRRLQIANALIQQKLHDFLFEKNKLVEVAQPLNQEVAPSPEPPQISASEDANSEAPDSTETLEK